MQNLEIILQICLKRWKLVLQNVLYSITDAICDVHFGDDSSPGLTFALLQKLAAFTVSATCSLYPGRSAERINVSETEPSLSIPPALLSSIFLQLGVFLIDLSGDGVLIGDVAIPFYTTEKQASF